MQKGGIIIGSAAALWLITMSSSARLCATAFIVQESKSPTRKKERKKEHTSPVSLQWVKY